MPCSTPVTLFEPQTTTRHVLVHHGAILIPPSFPSSRLLHAMSIPETLSSDKNQNTKTDPFSSSSTTITLTGLPPNTLKADIRLIFQRFWRGLVQPDRRRADVVFVDVNGVKRTLHAYTESTLRVRGREIIVFRKKVSGMVMDTDTPSRATRTEQGHTNRAIFVYNFPPTATREELLYRRRRVQLLYSRPKRSA